MTTRTGFHGLGIAPGILSVLDKLGLLDPTPIQEQSIPHVIEGKDIMGIAQTGTGKTFAFGIPLIQAMLKDRNARGLVVLPTRELAEQVHESLGKIGAPLGVKAAVLIGGESIRKQLQALSRSPQIILATPGRLIDHLEQRSVTLKAVTIVVLDEADRMLDMGFGPQLSKIMAALPHERQTLLFSATMPENIVRMARTYMKLPTRVEIARPGTAATDVTQEVFFVSQPEKPRLLEKIVQEYHGSVLVFARTKFSVKKIAMYLRSLDYSAVEFHSNRSLNQRREALDGFKKGKYRIVVATDIAARGIDVQNIELVVNYDLPMVAEDYVHRIGRTGRAGAAGHAISFARPDEKRDVQTIERVMRRDLPISRVPELPPMHAMKGVPEFSRPDRPSYGSRQGSRSPRAPYPSQGGGDRDPRRFGPPRPPGRFSPRPPRRPSR